MAKSRKPVRKSARKATRKTSTRRPVRKSSAAKPKRNEVELNSVRTKLQGDVARLQGATQTDKVVDTIDRLNRCLAEIDEICGPNMNVPLE